MPQLTAFPISQKRRKTHRRKLQRESGDSSRRNPGRLHRSSSASSSSSDLVGATNMLHGNMFPTDLTDRWNILPGLALVDYVNGSGFERRVKLNELRDRGKEVLHDGDLVSRDLR
ncbi:hypothetical protein FF1_009662 [Malus domestica]